MQITPKWKVLEKKSLLWRFLGMSTYIYSHTTRKARDINGYKSIIYISVSNLGLEKSTKLYFTFQTLGRTRL